MNALKLEEIIGEFCDNYCQYPCQIKDVGELEKVCAECPINQLMELN